MANDFKTFIKGKDLVFILTPNRIYCETKSTTFYLDPIRPYWKRRVNFIGSLIMLGEINNLDSLARYSNGSVYWNTIEHLKDIVYVVKKNQDNEELRYSLRSLKNIKHRKVVIVGYKPDWVKNVVYIPVINQKPNWVNSRYADTEYKWSLACKDERVSNNFYLFNDDFFLLKYVYGLPNYYRGSLDDHIKDNGDKLMYAGHTKALINTKEYINKRLGISQDKDFELHLPMIINKNKRLQIHEMILPYYKKGITILARSVYGNLFLDKTMFRKDCKNIIEKKDCFTSTTDDSFNKEEIGQNIRDLFKEKSMYEV